MDKVILVCLCLSTAGLDFGFAAENLCDGRYIMFSIELVLGIVLSLTSVALLISMLRRD